MLSFVIGMVIFIVGMVIFVISVVLFVVGVVIFVNGAQKLLDLMLRILEFKPVNGVQDGLSLLGLVLRGDLQEVPQVVGGPFDIFDPESGQGHLKVHLSYG